MKRLTAQRGFTLIELALYMGLFGILIVILTQFFIAILSVKLNSENTSALQQDGQYILTRISYDLRRAKSISTPLLGNESDNLTAIITDNGVDTQYHYYLNNGNLLLTKASTTSQLNSDQTQLTNFRIQRIGNSAHTPPGKDTGMISLTVMSKYTITSSSTSVQFQTTVGLR